MALIDPCAFLGLSGNSYPAARLRRVVQLLMGSREGVLSAGALAVTQTGTPSLSVSVAAGAGAVNGDDIARQGVYVAENDAAVTVGPVTTPHASLPRVDRLILEILDQEGTGSGGGGRASDLPQFRIVAGTPASSPSAPAEPATAITLALIAVGPSATSILDASITDARVVLSLAPPWGNADIAAGAITTSKIADANIVNQHIADTAVSTGKLQNGAVTGAKLAATTTVAITLANGWANVGGSNQTAQAQRDVNGRVHLRGLILPGSNTNVGFVPAGYLPVADETFSGFGGTIKIAAGTGLITAGALNGNSLSGMSYQGA